MICQRVGCENEVIPPRRKFCCDKCNRRTSKDRADRKLGTDHGKLLREKCTDVKLRVCLVCGTIFTSQHSGNRICGPCSASGTHYTQKPPRTGARSCLGDGR